MIMSPSHSCLVSPVFVMKVSVVINARASDEFCSGEFSFHGEVFNIINYIQKMVEVIFEIKLSYFSIEFS